MLEILFFLIFCPVVLVLCVWYVELTLGKPKPNNLTAVAVIFVLASFIFSLLPGFVLANLLITNYLQNANVNGIRLVCSLAFWLVSMLVGHISYKMFGSRHETPNVTLPNVNTD